jgi:putative Ca2+/H+ antiporter (TMEM165/GDT1 family)
MSGTVRPTSGAIAVACSRLACQHRCKVFHSVPPMPIEAFLVSTVVVALSEMGDKTQLLALVLAARFRRPLPIVLGIVVATLVNHTLAGALGSWVRSVVPEEYLRWLLAASFVAVALWALKPDREDQGAVEAGRFGVFAVTVTSFFMAEMGDKTQIATVMLAAQFNSLPAVIAGTTLGMLLADVPVVYLGRAAATKIPLRLVRAAAAALFLVLAVVALLVR